MIHLGEAQVRRHGAAHQLTVSLSILDVIVLYIPQVTQDAEALHARTKGQMSHGKEGYNHIQNPQSLHDSRSLMCMQVKK